MKVVVTGASGLIGTSAVEALKLAGLDVFPVTRESLTHGASKSSDGLPLDLRDTGAVSPLAGLQPDLLVHTAAVLPRSYVGNDAESAAAANRIIDDVVLATAERIGCDVIYLSGTSLYGCVQNSCREDSAVTPRGPYLLEKHRSEERFLRRLKSATVLRVSSPYGERQQAETVLNRFVRQAAKGEELRYYGSGAREQDFIAVDDVSSAIVAAAQARVAGIFNIASGRPVSMKQLALMVLDSVEKSRSLARAAGIDDPEEACRARFEITKAERVLGWRPGVDLQAGIRRLLTAYQR